MKKTIIINGKEYEMPKVSADMYIEYLSARDDILGEDRKGALYSAKQFNKMITTIVKLYDNQFTVEELKNPDTGLSAAGIIIEFMSLEATLGTEVDEKIEKIKENFINGK